MVNEEQRTPAGPAATETAPAPDDAPETGRAARPRAAAPRPTGAQAPGAVGQPVRRRHRRPEMIQKRREERYRQYERQRKQWFYTRIGLAAVAVLVVGAIAFVVYSWVQDQIDEQALDDVQEFAYDGGAHQEGEITYAENPPVGGPHNTIYQDCGFYEAPVPPWHAVHSLEHGAVWITYRPDLPQDQIDELRELADSDNFILASPRPDQTEPLILSAWNHQLTVDSVDERSFDAFIREYRSNPETTPEFGASCQGGNTTTLG